MPVVSGAVDRALPTRAVKNATSPRSPRHQSTGGAAPALSSSHCAASSATRIALDAEHRGARAPCCIGAEGLPRKIGNAVPVVAASIADVASSLTADRQAVGHFAIDVIAIEPQPPPLVGQTRSGVGVNPAPARGRRRHRRSSADASACAIRRSAVCIAGFTAQLGEYATRPLLQVLARQSRTGAVRSRRSGSLHDRARFGTKLMPPTGTSIAGSSGLSDEMLAWPTPPPDRRARMDGHGRRRTDRE